MDAIALLRADHEKVLAMFNELEAGRATKTVTADQQHARKKLVTELVIAESQHEAVEEEFFWPTVRATLPDGEQLATQAISQENDAKQLLRALENAEPTDTDFELMITRIIDDGREHIEFEQNEVWPKLHAALSARQLAELGEKMAHAKNIAPTRPHPATPAHPAALKTVGRAAAAADRARDAATGRGTD